MWTVFWLQMGATVSLFVLMADWRDVSRELPHMTARQRSAFLWAHVATHLALVIVWPLTVFDSWRSVWSPVVLACLLGAVQLTNWAWTLVIPLGWLTGNYIEYTGKR